MTQAPSCPHCGSKNLRQSEFEIRKPDPAKKGAFITETHREWECECGWFGKAEAES